jgi:hypothetical protein
MRLAARTMARGASRTLLVSLAVAACSVYEPELLEDAGAAVGAGGGGAAGSSFEPGAGKPSAAGKGGGSVIATGGTGATPQEPGEAGESGVGSSDTGGTSSGSAGSAGAPTSGTTGSAGGGAGGGPVTAPGDLLDGFEDEDLTLEQSGGRGGVWYLFDDGTAGSVGPSPLVTSKVVDAPAALGLFGLHITASGFSGYGSGLGVDFKAGKKAYDASKYSGVRFWARVGEGKNTRHRLQLVDATTDKLGGKCNPSLDAPEGEKCDDHFGKNLVLTTDWTLYVVPFSDLSQIGWGLPGASLDKATLYGLQLTAKPKLDVDLWLDQIEFF